MPIKLPLLKALRSVWRPPERIYQHLHFQGVFEVTVTPGAQFRIQSYGNAVENDLFWVGYAGNWERTSLRVWRDLCPGASTVLDVGANTGVYALTASALRPQSRVIAFEPVPRVFARLQLNTALNGGRITVEHVAVSDRDGVATLHDVDSAHVYSASLDYQMLGSQYTRSYEVPAVSLDTYCREQRIDRVDLVKIDVERHEPAVFRGFQRMLATSRPTILVEVLDAGIGRAIAEAIRRLGYLAYAVDDGCPQGGILPVQKLGTAERNYLLCQPEIAQRIGLAAAIPLE